MSDQILSLPRVRQSQPRRVSRPVFGKPQRLPRSLTAKHWFDWCAALVLLVPVFPVLCVLWLLVRGTSAGPGLFFQKRVGLLGREFWICKLRTMTVNCEHKTGAVWAQPNDPRVTPIGRILRATHLDELPQLFNVLRGEMSLVGPRPERPEIIRSLLPEIPNYPERLQVRPGVTGLAQIYAPADLTIEDVRCKLQYDLKYMQQMTIWLDVRVIACTALKVVGLNRGPVRSILFPVISALPATDPAVATPDVETPHHMLEIA